MTPDDVLKTLHHLASGGMAPAVIGEVYETLRPSLNGGFTEDHTKEALRIISGAVSKERNIAQEVHEWIALQDGTMNISDCYRDLNITSKAGKHSARMVLQRILGKTIEREGAKSGVYRKIGENVHEQQWWIAQGKPLNVAFPLAMTHPKIMHGNIILLEGAKSQGKTRWALEFARLNRKLFNDRVRYQNVEMGDDEILARAKAYEADGIWTPEDFRKTVEIRRITSGWYDYIHGDSLNIIDYIVEYEEPYKIAHHIFKVHEKLMSGIALVIVQRDPAKLYGSGGYAIRNIPRLIVSLQNHVIKMEDVKAFWISSLEDHNPTGLMRRYKMPGLWKMVPDGEWTRSLDPKQDKRNVKYKEFEGFLHEE